MDGKAHCRGASSDVSAINGLRVLQAVRTRTIVLWFPGEQLANPAKTSSCVGRSPITLPLSLFPVDGPLRSAIVPADSNSQDKMESLPQAWSRLCLTRLESWSLRSSMPWYAAR
jgi:hypothetical protein